MADIFISYARGSKKQVETLVDDLETHGYSVWFDKELHPGHAWWDQILENVRACDIFIFALSNSSVESEACKLELEYARKLGKSFVPLLIADDVNDSLVPKAIAEIERVDYRTQDKKAYQLLGKALANLPEPKLLPDPLPEPPELPIDEITSLSQRINAVHMDDEEQAKLIQALKTLLADPEETAEARVLLRRLKQHPDLIEENRKEINKLLLGRKPVWMVAALVLLSSAMWLGWNTLFNPLELLALTVTTTPEDADVVLVYPGNRTEPYPGPNGNNFLEGSYVLEVSREGYYPKNVSIDLGDTTEFHIELDQSHILLDITDMPANAEIIITHKSSYSYDPNVNYPEGAAAGFVSKTLVSIDQERPETYEPGRRYPEGEYLFEATLTGYEMMRYETSISSADQSVSLPLQFAKIDQPIPLPEMVTIPTGTFRMGSEDGNSDERPVHEVSIRSFRLSSTEITFEQYDVYSEAMGAELVNDRGWGREERPVILVSWNDIQGYIEWLNFQTGEAYRLPSEAEWEYAARAKESSESNTAYSWGDEIGSGNANCRNCGSEWDYEQTAPVGSFEPNAFGLYDMHGNVWEWVQDCYESNYNNAPDDGSAYQGGDCGYRVLRGGSWFNIPGSLRSAFRYTLQPSFRNFYFYGFRLAQDL